MLELLATISLSISLGTNVVDVNRLVLNNVNMTSVEFEELALNETSSFENAQTITKDVQYSSYFTKSNNKAYFRFYVPESGFYSFHVICNSIVTTNVYYQSENQILLFTTYSEKSSSQNFGYENSFYVDKTENPVIYFESSTIVKKSNLYYIAEVSNLNHHSNFANEFAKFDVDKKLTSYVNLNYTDDGSIGTSGYNPNDILYSFPTGKEGESVKLNLGNANNICTTTTYPYSTIARNYSGGTGYLIEKNVYITAAHCVFDYTTQKWKFSSNDEVVFGRNSKDSYAAIGKVKYIYVDSKYLNNGLDNNDTFYDWAVCILDDNYGDTLGYLPIRRSSNVSLSNSELLIVDGYRCFDLSENTYYQYLSYCSYVGKENFDGENRKVDYTNNTSVGNSGSPVFDSNYNVIATHVGTGSNKSKSGTMFVDKLYFLSEKLLKGELL